MSEFKCIRDNKTLIYPCPHCGLLCITDVAELACRIFRHGYNIAANTQIPPHASIRDCDKFAKTRGVYGCCRPYRITQKNADYYVAACGYI
jgi:hypothetical protein